MYIYLFTHEMNKKKTTTWTLFDNYYSKNWNVAKRICNFQIKIKIKIKMKLIQLERLNWWLRWETIHTSTRKWIINKQRFEIEKLLLMKNGNFPNSLNVLNKWRPSSIHKSIYYCHMRFGWIFGGRKLGRNLSTALNFSISPRYINRNLWDKFKSINRVNNILNVQIIHIRSISHNGGIGGKTGKKTVGSGGRIWIHVKITFYSTNILKLYGWMMFINCVIAIYNLQHIHDILGIVISLCRNAYEKKSLIL